MTAEENCAFDYIKILEASAQLVCDESAADATRPCDSVKLSFTGTKTKNVDGDDAQYQVVLRAVNASKVHYKGHDGTGYSVCCSLLHAPNASCSWLRSSEDEFTTLRIDHCLLNRPPSTSVGSSVNDQPRNLNLSGNVTKPLHRLLEGPWEGTIIFLRHKKVVGRLVIPFSVPVNALRNSIESNEQVAATSASSSTTLVVLPKSGAKDVNASHQLQHGNAEL